MNSKAIRNRSRFGTCNIGLDGNEKAATKKRQSGGMRFDRSSPRIAADMTTFLLTVVLLH